MEVEGEAGEVFLVSDSLPSGKSKKLDALSISFILLVG